MFTSPADHGLSPFPSQIYAGCLYKPESAILVIMFTAAGSGDCAKMNWKQEKSGSNPFVTRLLHIPLIKSSWDLTTSTYQNVKNSNRLIGGSLQLAENCVNLANQAASPLKKIVEGPVMAVSEIADHQLEKLQYRFPVINTTPEQLTALGQRIYEGTGAKATVQAITNAKNRINSTVQNMVQNIRYLILSTIMAIHSRLTAITQGTLNTSERMIDRYIASPDGGQRHCSPEQSYLTQVGCLVGKTADGGVYHVMSLYHGTKQAMMNIANAIHQTVHSAASSVSASIHRAISAIVSLRNAILNEIAKRIGQITATSASGAVYMAKAITNGVADASDYVVSTASPYLPEGMEKPTATLLSYVHHWQERVQKASSAEDIWRAAVDEAKQNVRLAKQVIQTILNNGDSNVDSRKKRW